MYVELHCHSAFSFLDGASLPDELVATALELGYEALALTDHNSVSGSMEFAVSRPGAGPAPDPRSGDRPRRRAPSDAARRGRPRLVEPVPDPDARARAHARGRRGPPIAAVRAAARRSSDHAEGLVCLSGCALRGVHDEFTLRRLLDAFGRDRLRIELQRPFLRDDRARNRRLAGLGAAARRAVRGDRQRARARTLAGAAAGRVRGRAPAHDARRLRAAAAGQLQPRARRRRRRWRLASPSIPRRSPRPRGWPSGCASTSAATSATAIPGAEDADAMRKLIELCDVRLADRYARARPPSVARRAQARLQEELRIIEQAGPARLLPAAPRPARAGAGGRGRGARARHAPVRCCRPGRGRGSSVSSIVCYLTGLSHVDPIANELMIGRFLNEELTSLPDIDLDFPRDIRERLIPRVHERYGHDRSALVAAFPTYRARGAIRELGKALGCRRARSSGWRAAARDGTPARSARTSRAHSGSRPGRRARAAPTEHQVAGARPGRWAWLARLAAEAHGLPRHLSQHSGGMIVATRPLIDCCPIVPGGDGGPPDRPVGQGLLLGRRLSEDRPARVWGCCRRSSAASS